MLDGGRGCACLVFRDRICHITAISPDAITAINDILGASADDAEKATKSLLQSLRKIREEDVSSLLTKLQKHITDQSASDARAVEALLEHSTPRFSVR